MYNDRVLECNNSNRMHSDQVKWGLMGKRRFNDRMVGCRNRMHNDQDKGQRGKLGSGLKIDKEQSGQQGNQWEEGTRPGNRITKDKGEVSQLGNQEEGET
jgi:hypothetical protein